MRTALYVRVSTAESAKDGYSIGEQEERLKNYCKAKDWEVYHVYIDGGYSGKDTDRPALQDLLADLERGLFDIVLVYKLDRLSRSQKDTMELIEDVFIPNKIDFVSMTENLDTTTPVGMAMIGLLSVFAQLERAQIAERMAVGKDGRAKEGKWHGSTFTPIGYEYIDGELKTVPHEAYLVKQAFEMFNNRTPVNRICTEFLERGLKHRYGYWVPQTLKNALKNKIYVGYINHDGKSYKGLHDPIISEETFDKAQLIFEERDKANPNYKNAFKYSSALSGLLVCKHCGARYCKQHGWKRASGEQTYYYICYSRAKKTKSLIKDPNCKNKLWRMDELDRKIYNEVTKLAFDDKYIEAIKNDTDNDKEKQKRMVVIKKRIEELSEQIKRTSLLFTLGTMDVEEIKAQLDPLTDERQALRNELEYMEAEAAVSTEQTLEIAQSFGEVLESGNLERIRFVLEELITRIVIDDDKIKIEWRFA